ncbi:hypothetical protein SR1949_19350 [Sphaerospermopsis reniformis]|uniref:Uncharacterized protein n=1 Tax=Sphaerospermopsis reniformis TaxID=531300 RepID=A0A479ZVX4_9CYAN|nr:hypothetical protein [Sphaerospermopsis reniformis]GCL36829.1 hypothetical protein SR1949_19350 [Sphaerospermopsis reniformis]
MLRSLRSVTAILLFALVNITTLPTTVKAQDSNVEKENFTVSLKSCDRSGKIIKCHLLLTSKKKFDIRVYGRSGNYPTSRIFDSFGNEYNAASVKIGNTENADWVDKQLLEGIPTKLMLTFNEIPPEVKEIAVLDIRSTSNYANTDNTEFRNIVIFNRVKK